MINRKDKEKKIYDAKYGIEYNKKIITKLEQELKKLEVKVYEPHYLDKIPSQAIFTDKQLDYNEFVDRHNAMEDFKHELSKLNNGWFPDWKDKNQRKCFLYISCYHNEILAGMTSGLKDHNDYEYFNPDLAEQVKKELGGLWMRGKGIL